MQSTLRRAHLAVASALVLSFGSARHRLPDASDDHRSSGARRLERHRRAAWHSSKPRQAVHRRQPRGSSGSIGTQAAARAPTTATRPHDDQQHAGDQSGAVQETPFDPVKDTVPIAPVAKVPNVLVANPSFPRTT
jgi:hypothetical protein